MGIYLNPGNAGFQAIIKGRYVDKTALIPLINSRIGTQQKLICVSRPRRFGKSYAAKMLCAYYDKSCTSAELFRGLTVEKDPSFHSYLNQLNVIYLDITGFISSAVSENRGVDTVVLSMRESILQELQAAYPDIPADSSLGNSLVRTSQETGDQFFFIIDEWDALFREASRDSRVQTDYIGLLRELFKNGNVTDVAVAGAYMTGILPIKKYGTQSAISDFREYTMVKPRMFAPFVGFTADEVRKLCTESGMDYDEMKEWYDGYTFDEVGSVYNPNSVMEAIENRDFDSYWSSSETYESLRYYIDIDFEGLQKDIVRMLGGERIPVSTTAFQNDMTSIKDRNDVLTLLTHLGYLAYDGESETVRIPNSEVRIQFLDAVRHSHHEKTAELIRESDRLIEYTWEGNEEKVAEEVEKFHDQYSTPLFYNNEQSLRSVIRISYIGCINHYIRIEELPSGKGFADMAFIPRKTDPAPAMIIELKWNQEAEVGLHQIEEKEYKQVLEGHGGEVLLVGISYDSVTKKHSCGIRREII